MEETWRMDEAFSHELVLPNADLPFKMFLFEGKDGNYRRARHWHRSIEIFLVMEGQLEFAVGNDSRPLGAGDFVIVNSNEIHSIEAPEPNATVVVQIPLSCFSGYLDGDGRTVFMNRGGETDRAMARLIGEMFTVYEKKEAAYELKVRSLFLELQYRLVTEFMETEENRDNIRQKRRLEKLSGITAYMKKNYSRDITLESVAGEFGFSPTYLSRMFKRYAGVSYKTYLLNLRTEYALREMMSSDRSLNDIALGSGFPGSRAFARAFSKRYGCLPSAYRSQMRNQMRSQMRNQMREK